MPFSDTGVVASELERLAREEKAKRGDRSTGEAILGRVLLHPRVPQPDRGVHQPRQAPADVRVGNPPQRHARCSPWLPMLRPPHVPWVRLRHNSKKGVCRPCCVVGLTRDLKAGKNPEKVAAQRKTTRKHRFSKSPYQSMFVCLLLFFFQIFPIKMWRKHFFRKLELFRNI